MSSTPGKDEPSEVEDSTTTNETEPTMENSEANNVAEKSPVMEHGTRSYANTIIHTQLVTQLLGAKGPQRKPENLRQTQVMQMPN